MMVEVDVGLGCSTRAHMMSRIENACVVGIERRQWCGLQRLVPVAQESCKIVIVMCSEVVDVHVHV